MKIIFLDIDGVLNNEIHFILKSEEDRYERDGYPLCHLCSSNIKWLNYLIEKTEAKIVISSTWRKGKSVEEIAGYLVKKGFKYPKNIIDKTPSLFIGNEVKSGSGYTIPRGCEIQCWIEYNKKLLNYEYESHFHKYIILDDDCDMLYHQRNNFFRCDNYVGLTRTIAAEAIYFLNK